MKTVTVKKLEIDTRGYLRRTALETDASVGLTAGNIVYCDGKPIIICTKVPKLEMANLRWAVKNLRYPNDWRSDGLPTHSRIFGFMPRIVARHDYCKAAMMATDEPKQHFSLTEFAETIIGYYSALFEDKYKAHKELVEGAVDREWRIGTTPFTSGIVNQNNQLLYHYDSGNFKDVASAMICLRSGTTGGYLVCPEYDIKFECDDGDLLIFDGQSIMHGVTPMRGRAGQYRYTVVYYSLTQMQNCQTTVVELERIRNVKTEREQKRVT